MKTQALLILLFVLTLILPATGCSGKKKAVKKDYGKPAWLAVDESKFAKLSEDATELEGGTITVYDPEGWERQPRGSAKPPKGFKSVIVFKKENATIMMTKSQDAKELPDLDEGNVEEFANGVQQKFKATVKMVKLGDKVGVYFSRRVADAQRLSKFYERSIIATTIHGGLFTYELISDGKITDSLLNSLYAVISKTQFAGSESEDSAVAETTEEKKPIEVAAAEPKEEPKEETKPDTKPEPVETTAKPVAEEKPAEKPVTEVAAAPKAEEKPKLAEKPAAKKPAVKKPPKKGNTKDILNELDALLN